MSATDKATSSAALANRNVTRKRESMAAVIPKRTCDAFRQRTDKARWHKGHDRHHSPACYIAVIVARSLAMDCMGKHALPLARSRRASKGPDRFGMAYLIGAPKSRTSIPLSQFDSRCFIAATDEAGF